MTPRIEIEIDMLIVRGLAPGAASAAAAGLEARLTALATGHEGAIRGRTEHSRRLPPIDASVDGVGEAVAGAVWGAVSGGAT